MPVTALIIEWVAMSSQLWYRVLCIQFFLHPASPVILDLKNLQIPVNKICTFYYNLRISSAFSINILYIHISRNFYISLILHFLQEILHLHFYITTKNVVKNELTTTNQLHVLLYHVRQSRMKTKSRSKYAILVVLNK